MYRHQLMHEINTMSRSEECNSTSKESKREKRHRVYMEHLFGRVLATCMTGAIFDDSSRCRALLLFLHTFFSIALRMLFSDRSLFVSNLWAISKNHNNILTLMIITPVRMIAKCMAKIRKTKNKHRVSS